MLPEEEFHRLALTIYPVVAVLVVALPAHRLVWGLALSLLEHDGWAYHAGVVGLMLTNGVRLVGFARHGCPRLHRVPQGPAPGGRQAHHRAGVVRRGGHAGNNEAEPPLRPRIAIRDSRCTRKREVTR